MREITLLDWLLPTIPTGIRLFFQEGSDNSPVIELTNQSIEDRKRIINGAGNLYAIDRDFKEINEEAIAIRGTFSNGFLRKKNRITFTTPAGLFLIGEIGSREGENTSCCIFEIMVISGYPSQVRGYSIEKKSIYLYSLVFLQEAEKHILKIKESSEYEKKVHSLSSIDFLKNENILTSYYPYLKRNPDTLIVIPSQSTEKISVYYCIEEKERQEIIRIGVDFPSEEVRQKITDTKQEFYDREFILRLRKYFSEIIPYFRKREADFPGDMECDAVSVSGIRCPFSPLFFGSIAFGWKNKKEIEECKTGKHGEFRLSHADVDILTEWASNLKVIPIEIDATLQFHQPFDAFFGEKMRLALLKKFIPGVPESKIEADLISWLKNLNVLTDKIKSEISPEKKRILLEIYKAFLKLKTAVGAFSVFKHIRPDSLELSGPIEFLERHVKKELRNGADILLSYEIKLYDKAKSHKIRSNHVRIEVSSGGMECKIEPWKKEVVGCFEFDANVQKGKSDSFFSPLVFKTCSVDILRCSIAIGSNQLILKSGKFSVRSDFSHLTLQGLCCIQSVDGNTILFFQRCFVEIDPVFGDKFRLTCFDNIFLIDHGVIKERRIEKEIRFVASDFEKPLAEFVVAPDTVFNKIEKMHREMELALAPILILQEKRKKERSQENFIEKLSGFFIDEIAHVPFFMGKTEIFQAKKSNDVLLISKEMIRKENNFSLEIIVRASIDRKTKNCDVVVKVNKTDFKFSVLFNGRECFYKTVFENFLNVVGDVLANMGTALSAKSLIACWKLEREIVGFQNNESTYRSRFFAAESEKVMLTYPAPVSSL